MPRAVSFSLPATIRKNGNALKLLNEKGEFISAEIGAWILEKVSKDDYIFAPVDKLGELSEDGSYLKKHIDAVIAYPLVDREAIKARNFKVVVDVINSTGALFVPPLLRALGVDNIIVLNGEVSGNLPIIPNPCPRIYPRLSSMVKKEKADLGIAVDPDVDRLCFVCEDGSMFGEEFTLVAVADYMLSRKPGNTVSNMSSTKALKDVTLKHGGEYFPSAVGEK